MAKTSGTAELTGKDAAKAFVNARRKELGLRATGRLPKGYPCNQVLCPISKALESVGVMFTDYDGEEVVLMGPGRVCSRTWKDPETAKFMADYDAGLYPELVITPKPIKTAGK